jgi:N-acetylmuramoyl-L-alanine amidase
LTLRPLPLLTAAVTLAVSFALVSLSSQTPAATPLTLLSKDGRRAMAITPVNEQEFVSLDDLAGIFQLAVREDALGAITVTYKGKTIVLTPDQVLASVNGRLVSLPAAPTRVNRRVMVPVEFISRALAPIYDTRLDLRKPSHLLVVGDLRVPRVTVRYDLVGSGGRLTIDATPRASSTISQDNEHLTIKFDADALDVANPPLPPPGQQSLVQNVRGVDATTLVVDLAPRVSGFRASTQPIDTTTRLEIDVATPQSEQAQAAPPVPVAPPPDLPPALTQTAPAIRTIALDPGHGGGDEGVKGEGGTKEKDLVLAVARRIKAAIEGRLGIRVLLTRDDDRDLPIDDRTAIANNNKADLFISLHANGSLKSAATGASIYYAAFEKDADANGQDALRPERVPTFGGGLRDIELVAWNLAQMRHLDQSTAFASILQQQLQNRLPLAARPVDRAPLRVLESANMPAVLVEMGFLTNADQEKQLTGGEFQNTLTQALLDAVLRFRDSLPGGATR